MLIAEELECDWSRSASSTRPRRRSTRTPAFGMQMTGGSTTTWSEFDRYRKVGAMARDMLVRAAARGGRSTRSDCARRTASFTSAARAR